MAEGLVFQQLFEKESSTYTYLLADAASKEAVLIDSVIETVDRDLSLISELGFKLKYVLDTHIHADHVTGAGEIRNRTGAQTAVAKNANVPCVDLNLKEGDSLKFGSFEIKVLETPGHTDASLSFYSEGMVFTGDALLIRGCGRTDFQSGSASTLFDSVVEKIFKLPPDTIVYPAHDYKGFTSSSIEAEIRHNPRLGHRRTKSEFIEIMKNLNLPYPKQIDRAVPANLGCGSVSVEAIKTTDANDLLPEELLENKNGALIVDVRSSDEFNDELGHIAGSHQITLGDKLKSFLEGYDRKEEIVFVCRSGRRSEEAVQAAMQLGFKKVASLKGGMLGWNERGFPTEKG